MPSVALFQYFKNLISEIHPKSYTNIRFIKAHYTATLDPKGKV